MVHLLASIKNSRGAIAAWLLSIGLGMATAISVLAQFLKAANASTVLWIFTFVGLSVPLSLIVEVLLSRWIFPRLAAYRARSRWIWVLGSLLGAIWFAYAIPLPQFPDPKLGFLPFLAEISSLAFLFFVLSVWLITMPAPRSKSNHISPWTPLLYALPLGLAWCLFLLAFWPGSLSYDSVDQWTQMVAFKFTDWHPVFHTLTNWLITRIWYSPAAIALAQIVAMSLVLGWGLSEQRKLGAPRWLPWAVIAAIILVPSNGLMTIVLWKDIFYSISVTALTILLFKIVMSRGKWMQRRAAWIYLGVVAALAALFRQNGPLVSLGALICLLALYWKAWKRILLSLALAVALWAGVRGPLYSLLGVDRTGVPALGMAFAHLIARYTNTSTPFSPQDRSLLLQIRPERRWPYECQLETNLFFTKLNWANLSSDTAQLAVLSANLVYRNPSVFVDHMLCNSAFLYQIEEVPGSLYEPMETGVYPNSFGITRETKLPGLHSFITHWANQANPATSWIFWRVPFWGYLFLAGLGVYWARSRNWRVIVLVVPVLLNMIPLSFLTVLQSFRYVYPTLLVGMLMSPFFLLAPLPPRENVKETHGIAQAKPREDRSSATK